MSQHYVRPQSDFGPVYHWTVTLQHPMVIPAPMHAWTNVPSVDEAVRSHQRLCSGRGTFLVWSEELGVGRMFTNK